MLLVAAPSLFTEPIVGAVSEPRRDWTAALPVTRDVTLSAREGLTERRRPGANEESSSSSEGLIGARADADPDAEEAEAGSTPAVIPDLSLPSVAAAVATEVAVEVPCRAGTCLRRKAGFAEDHVCKSHDLFGTCVDTTRP